MNCLRAMYSCKNALIQNHWIKWENIRINCVQLIKNNDTSDYDDISRTMKTIYSVMCKDFEDLHSMITE